ncbi:hypothetical protein F7018_02725 [Tenacibaculum aiptasiae]|uniref:Galactose oxidase n=1 Tax=Tenacibaculum aiptasiae TaxID=426481 RepID=A0A7J5AT47_9FLAO|nr:hypothetical protein [Tenacibaculum aiptasiae]KAB1160807.1 hypothetical protein F7018_02725 [Tenacibaculum aiptasiae]
MNSKIIFPLLLCVSLLIGCSEDTIVKNNTSASVNTPYVNLNLSSTLISSTLPARNGAEIITFKGEYWFMGGEEPFLRSNNTYFNDIWKSNDGVNWTKVIDNAPWQGRSDFNLLTFNNKLWIIGGKNNNNDITEWLNDIWQSDDGINWTQVAKHGPWETRESMSVSVHNNKMYLIGGHSLTNWHLYQDIWESSNGKNWTKVGSISDALLGTESSRQGIQEHTIIKLNNEYYLIAGQLASIFTAHTRVLKSKDMINWSVATINTPWKNYKYNNLGDLRPFIYKGNLVVVVNTGLIKIANTGDVKKDYLPAKQLIYSSKDGVNWEEKAELDKLPNVNGQLSLHMLKPRVLHVNNEIYLYGSYRASIVNKKLDTETHIYKITNN